MDYLRNPGEPKPASPTVTPAAPVEQKKPRHRSRPSLVILLILIVAALAGAAGYMWRDKDAKEQARELQGEVDRLGQQASKLQADLAAAQGDTADKDAEPKQPGQATLDNIEAAVESGNYAALENLMASKVNVIVAASEGVGMRTPAQAVSDLKYLDKGTDPWDFDLSAATITDYQSGDYKQYFPATAHVGKSANDYVVSFQFDSDSKISGIFMTVNDGLL